MENTFSILSKSENSETVMLVKICSNIQERLTNVEHFLSVATDGFKKPEPEKEKVEIPQIPGLEEVKAEIATMGNLTSSIMKELVNRLENMEKQNTLNFEAVFVKIDSLSTKTESNLDYDFDSSLAESDGVVPSNILVGFNSDGEIITNTIEHDIVDISDPESSTEEEITPEPVVEEMSEPEPEPIAEEEPEEEEIGIPVDITGYQEKYDDIEKRIYDTNREFSTIGNMLPVITEIKPLFKNIISIFGHRGVIENIISDINELDQTFNECRIPNDFNKSSQIEIEEFDKQLTAQNISTRSLMGNYNDLTRSCSRMFEALLTNMYTKDIYKHDVNKEVLEFIGVLINFCNVSNNNIDSKKDIVNIIHKIARTTSAANKRVKKNFNNIDTDNTELNELLELMEKIDNYTNFFNSETPKLDDKYIIDNEDSINFSDTLDNTIYEKEEENLHNHNILDAAWRFVNHNESINIPKDLEKLSKETGEEELFETFRDFLEKVSAHVSEICDFTDFSDNDDIVNDLSVFHNDIIVDMYESMDEEESSFEIAINTVKSDAVELVGDIDKYTHIRNTIRTLYEKIEFVELPENDIDMYIN